MSTYRSTKDVAALVRESLKRELPGWKFSVKVQTYSGGSSITMSLMAGPDQVVEASHEYTYGTGIAPKNWYSAARPFPGYAQLNHYQFRTNGDCRLTNGVYLTPKGWEVMCKASEILHREHWDESDVQSDYFCCSFYTHIQVGQWDKEYQVKI